MKALITSWLPVMIWMGAIYWGSSKSVLPGPVSSPSSEGLLFRNALHFSEYAVLATLLWRALLNTLPARIKAKPSESNDSSRAIVPSKWWALPLAFAIALLYAVFDEWHQGFVPHRDARLLDVGVDMLGVIAALGVIWWRSAK